MTNSVDFSKTSMAEIYGSNCFSDATMKEHLPKKVYEELKAVQEGKLSLSLPSAEVIAKEMKDWAISKGATHFTHWFQPLTGLTAEKQDSFISPSHDGKILVEFNGKELIQGEPDASSFPNGGLRTTFEARGYTAWDTSSPAVIKDANGVKILAIPTAFVSYHGEALDKKVPLLRSMAAIDTQAIRVLRALGNTTSKRVFPNVGPEQEYFLIDEALFEKRPDLRLCGRTVFGTLGAKGQEMADHYFGAIKERVALFMAELNLQLWKLGISAKTQHNEVAPNQFEIATVYDSANISTDTNQLLMEVIKTVAKHHHMVALLHEKPFAQVNGSGKHNNWSLATDDGQNLLSPGDSPEENAQFLLFLTGIISAVDEYATLLRISTATAGNDYRLGAHEAPPAIVSIFLGDQLTEILDCITEERPLVKQNGRLIEIGLSTIPDFPKDAIDRNRTSPFAFTGNKFEFRMIGSSQSLAGPNTMLNAAVADVLCTIADRLDTCDDVMAEVRSIIKEFYRDHKRIIFNGNGYCEEWVREAEKRGLENLDCTVEALSHLTDSKYIEMLQKHRIFSFSELRSRQEIYLDAYCKQINIEASLMIEMIKNNIIGASNRYLIEILSSVQLQKANGLESKQLKVISRMLTECIDKAIVDANLLESLLSEANELDKGVLAAARFFRTKIVPVMKDLRLDGDELEKLTVRSYWPFPTYEDMLFRL
ncbi:MAG: glutamine synthetase III [Sphaerochaetaceae bacterium]|jgi:glutamine synthetase|nr:glutamine synthetase III [Sphaerochaetaceae bacterium]